jgi:cell division septation protein DedD
MAQNYSKKSASKRQENQHKSAFPVFVSGFILGIVACQVLPFLLKESAHNGTSDDQIIDIKPSIAPDFQFPNLLKGIEESDAIYLIQVSSFKNKDDAESLKVKLMLLNFEVFTEVYEKSTDDVWHRVVVGPFANKRESSQARKKLAENNFDSLLLKIDKN